MHGQHPCSPPASVEPGCSSQECALSVLHLKDTELVALGHTPLSSRGSKYHFLDSSIPSLTCQVSLSYLSDVNFQISPIRTDFFFPYLMSSSPVSHPQILLKYSFKIHFCSGFFFPHSHVMVPSLWRKTVLVLVMC